MKSKKSLRGQASIEQLFAISLGLAIISIIIYLAATYLVDNLATSNARDAVERLGAAADYVYALGPGSTEYVDVYLPGEISGVSITNSSNYFQTKGVIAINISISSGTSAFFVDTKAPLIGSLPPGRGKQTIMVQALDSGYVLIGQTGLVCSPSSITRFFNETNITGKDNITVTNTADFPITGIVGNFSGSASNVANISNISIASLFPGNSTVLNITYKNASIGPYSGIYLIKTANDGGCAVGVNVYVDTRNCSKLCALAGNRNGSCSSSCSLWQTNISNANCTGTNKYCCCTPLDTTGPNVTIAMSWPSCGGGVKCTITVTCNDSLSGISAAYYKLNDNSAWTSLGICGSNYCASPKCNTLNLFTNGSNHLQGMCVDSQGNIGSNFNDLFYEC